MSLSILFLTNNEKSFTNYRKDLAWKLAKHYKVANVSLKNMVVRGFFSVIRADVVISSDGQSNLLLSFCFWKPQVLILNGLGRYQRNKKFRALFIWLLNMKGRNVHLVCQNFRDYRYFRKFVQSCSIAWVAGSGGIGRKIGSDSTPLVICRTRKYAFIEDQLINFISNNSRVKIVGMTSPYLKPCPQMSFEGKCPQNQIFETSMVFLQFDGYGEGVPHSLVDAICSNMKIIISKSAWIKFGFYTFIASKPVLLEKDQGFYTLESGTQLYQSIKKMVGIETINEHYASELNIFLKRCDLKRKIDDNDQT